MSKKSPAAKTAFETIKRQYKEANHPPRATSGFKPKPEEQAAYNELTALGLLEPFTNSAWRLTEAGLAAVVA